LCHLPGDTLCLQVLTISTRVPRVLKQVHGVVTDTEGPGKLSLHGNLEALSG
jgi:hypothetical protein